MVKEMKEFKENVRVNSQVFEKKIREIFDEPLVTRNFNRKSRIQKIIIVFYCKSYQK